MEQSIFLAKLIGLYSLLMSLSMLIRKQMVSNIFRQLSEDKALSYILGVVMLFIGLMIVLTHNIWVVDFSLLITLFGWITLLEGSSYLFMSPEFSKRYISKMLNPYAFYIVALSYLVIGLFLSYFAFIT